MAIDVDRVVQAAIEAATQEPSSDAEAKRTPKRRLSVRRALLLGAGVVAVGRLAAPMSREILDSVQQRLEESGSVPEDEEQETDEDYYDEPEDEGDDDYAEEEDEDDEPEDEGDDDEPEDEGDDDDEPEDEGDEDFREDEVEDERPRPSRRARSRARTHS